MSGDIKVLPFSAVHLNHLELNETNSEIIGDPMTKEQFGLVNEGGPCWTLYHVEYGVIACYGVCILWPGVASCWTLPNTKLVQKFPVKFHKSVMNALESCIDGFELHRVYTTVLKTFATSMRWLERMGFKEEAYLKKYGPNGEDMIQYAWIKED